jgi:hypothetical protein
VKLTTLQQINCAISLIAYIALAGVMIWRSNVHKWPFLFSLSIFEIIFNLSLIPLSNPSDYAAYFYTYWVAQIVRALLGFGLIFDIVRAVPGVSLAPKNLIAGFTAAAGAMTAGSAWLASSGGASTFRLTMMALSLDRCIAVAWGTFAISLFLAMGFCGLGWTKTPLRLAATFLALTLISAANSYAMSSWPSLASRFDEFFNFCSIGVWITWSGIMYFEDEKETVMQSDRVREVDRALVLPTRKTAN